MLDLADQGVAHLRVEHVAVDHGELVEVLLAVVVLHRHDLDAGRRLDARAPVQRA